MIFGRCEIKVGVMSLKNKTEIISEEMIKSKIFVIRGKKVMLDRDLAKLYKVSTKALNQAR